MSAVQASSNIVEKLINGTPYRAVDIDGYRLLMTQGNDMSAHSIMSLNAPESIVPEYAMAMLRALVFSRRLDDILLIGLGGGDQTKYLYRHMPDAHLVAVEIDPGVVSAARACFDVPEDDERLSIVVADGRDYVETRPGSCDVLLCDAYDQNYEVPPALSGEDFYRACHEALRPGGIMAMNMDRRTPAWRAAHEKIVSGIFPSRLDLPVHEAQSVLVMFKDEYKPDRKALMRRAAELDKSLKLDLPKFVESLK